MEYITDLHIHSKYARATSPRADVPALAEWARKKGVAILGTGDFTHPEWLNELKTHLSPAENGLYEYNGIFFVPATEVSTIYVQDNKLRKIHHGILAPSFEIVGQICDVLERYGKLESDGRPTLSMASPLLVESLRSVSDAIEIYPMHAWTPWFGVFGSKSGFDSMDECYQDQTKYIHALETGLSSDPEMNWRLSSLDRFTLLSGSDMHSPENIGREAVVFEFDAEPSYMDIVSAIRNKDAKRIKRTIEFYPEEGKYHYDGHRACNVRLSPAESKKYNNRCPACGRPMTLGVLHRVEQLADRPEGYALQGAVPFERLIPLREIIGQVLHSDIGSRKVAEAYEKLINYFGSEYSILHATKEKLMFATDEKIALAILKVCSGDVVINPGYDGEYGKVIINIPGEPKQVSAESSKSPKQKSLLDYGP